jgi:cellulose synthase/poly-beta-1,6-N-acetylglucosamine synthase-like glycosyltransferase
MERGRQKIAYTASVIGMTLTLFVLEWTRVQPNSLIEFAYMSLLGLALVPLSLLLVSTIAYLMLRPASFPRAAIADCPNVAVLYVAYNDCLPEPIRMTLRNLEYPTAEVWLLSDSTRPDAIAMEEVLAPGVRILRRPSRRGGKAGAINDWIEKHGSTVRYVVPMDADAILAPGSLRTMVEVAEHPDNLRYAGFQTLMEVHPAVAPSVFARILGRSVKWGCRIVPLANQRLFGQAMYWGSNALLRVDLVRAAGGWVEDNICEDFALTARLDAAGHPIALLDVYNFEGFPPDALSLRERTVRWCKANLKVAPTIFRSKTGFAVRLNVLIPILFYLMAPTLVALLLINLIAPPDVPLHRTSTVLGAVLLTFVFLHRLVVVPRSRESLGQFGATLAVETLVILSFSLRVAWSFADVLLRHPRWVPSRKETRHLSVFESVRSSIPEVAFGALVLMLIVAYRAPFSSVLLSSVWVVSFLSTPAILWLTSRSPGFSTSGRSLREMSDRRTSA